LVPNLSSRMMINRTARPSPVLLCPGSGSIPCSCTSGPPSESRNYYNKQVLHRSCAPAGTLVSPHFPPRLGGDCPPWPGRAILSDRPTALSAWSGANELSERAVPIKTPACRRRRGGTESSYEPEDTPDHSRPPGAPQVRPAAVPGTPPLQESAVPGTARAYARRRAGLPGFQQHGYPAQG